MIKYLRIIRPVNLLIIALSQFLVRYCIIFPAFQVQQNATGEFPAHLSPISFCLLVLSTILIAAGGYIINDYFDIHIDEINKPGKNLVGKSISPAIAKNLFFILSGVGIALGLYVAAQTTKPVMGLVPVFSVFSLWMYSSHYKRRLLIGNLIVSLLCGLSLLIVGLYEPEFYGNFSYLLWYVVIAFLLSFIREIIKDIEDIDGDEQSQCKTLPIRFGINAAKWGVYFLILLTLTYIIFILHAYFYTNKIISFWYLTGMFLIPLTALFYLVFSADEKKDFHYASLFAKILMLCGVLTMFPFWYYFLK